MAVKLPPIDPVLAHPPQLENLPHYLKSMEGYFYKLMLIFTTQEFLSIYQGAPRSRVYDPSTVNVLAMSPGILETLLPFTAENVNKFKYIAYCNAGVPLADYCHGPLLRLAFDRDDSPTSLFIKIGKLVEVINAQGKTAEKVNA